MEKKSGDLDCKEGFLREMPSSKKSRRRKGKPKNLVRKGGGGCRVGFWVFACEVF